MYLIIVFLTLISSLTVGFYGAGLLVTSCLILAFFVSMFIFYVVALVGCSSNPKVRSVRFCSNVGSAPFVLGELGDAVNNPLLGLCCLAGFVFYNRSSIRGYLAAKLAGRVDSQELPIETLVLRGGDAPLERIVNVEGRGEEVPVEIPAELPPLESVSNPLDERIVDLVRNYPDPLGDLEMFLYELFGPNNFKGFIVSYNPYNVGSEKYFVCRILNEIISHMSSWVEPTTGYIDGTWIIARILSNEYQGPRVELVREGVGDVFRYVLECDYLHITNHVEFGRYIALLEQCAAVDPIFHMPF